MRDFKCGSEDVAGTGRGGVIEGRGGVIEGRGGGIRGEESC